MTTLMSSFPSVPIDKSKQQHMLLWHNLLAMYWNVYAKIRAAVIRARRQKVADRHTLAADVFLYVILGGEDVEMASCFVGEMVM